MTEKFLSTLLLMFISSCYFIYNARRDTAAKKNFDIVIQMTLEDVLVQRFEKKEMDEKAKFNKDIVNVTKRGNSSRRMIQARVYFNMKQTLRGFLSKV